MDLALALEDLRDRLELQVRLRRDGRGSLDARGLPVLLLPAAVVARRREALADQTRRRPCASRDSAAVGLLPVRLLRVLAERELDARRARPRRAGRRARRPSATSTICVLAADRVGGAVQHVGRRSCRPRARGRSRRRTGSITSRMRTSAVTLCVPSLTSPSTAVCECASMMPGVTCLPRPSISSGARGRGQRPCRRPRSCRRRRARSAFSRIPAGPSVQTVAPRTTTACGRRERAGLTARGTGRTSAPAPAARSFCAASPPLRRSFFGPGARSAVRRSRSPRRALSRAEGLAGLDGEVRDACPASSVPSRSDSPS